jgi:hypothetical protein
VVALPLLDAASPGAYRKMPLRSFANST